MTVKTTTAERLEKLGIVADKSEGLMRYYISEYCMKAVFNLCIERDRCGCICSASLNGESIPPGRAYSLIGKLIWYDAIADRWMQAGVGAGVKDLNETLRNSIKI